MILAHTAGDKQDQLSCKYTLAFQCVSLAKMIFRVYSNGKTDDLDHFRQGFLTQSFVCVHTFFMVFPSPTTHIHTHFSFRPIAVRLPDTHQHSETHTAEHEHLVLHTNHRELWDKIGRPIPSHCSQLHGAGLTRITLQGLKRPAETTVYR